MGNRFLLPLCRDCVSNKPRLRRAGRDASHARPAWRVDRDNGTICCLTQTSDGDL
ncbi:MAG: hypothetical protein SFX18_04815 [Pirellulales bacterium]|nr:hypothetical protein [Pirellulales bacterium]